MSDEFERLLRDALEDEAAGYEPHDGLRRIRTKISARRRRLRLVIPSLALAGAAAAAAAVIVLPDLLPSHHGTRPAARPTSPPAPRPSPDASSSASSSTSPSPTGPGVAVPAPTGSAGGSTGSRAVPVYYLGGNASQARLYREFHRRPATLSVIRDAVTAMLTEPPADPDYRPGWPAGTAVAGATRHGAVVSVELTAAAPSPLAAQELFWTVAATEPLTRQVVLVAPGGGGTTISRDDAAVGPVWVLSPVEGATVGRTFTASGLASVFEGRVSWELRKGGRVVLSGGTPGGGTGIRGPWSVSIAAPGPGAYQVVAYEASARDGSAQFVDSKTITVR